MANEGGKPKIYMGLIYGEPDTPINENWIEDLLKEEFDELDSLGQWKHVCALVGIALYQAQLFEADLLNILLLHAKVLGDLVTEEEYEAFETDLSGKTLGALLTKVRKQISIADDAEEILTDALRLRNGLCHGFFFRKANDLLTVAGMRRISAELIETKDKFENAEFVSQVICKSLLKLAGVTEDDLLAEFDREKEAARLLEGEP